MHINKKEDIKSKEFLNSKKGICSKTHHKFLRLQNEETNFGPSLFVRALEIFSDARRDRYSISNV